MDVFGSALLDEFNNSAAEVLWLHNSYGEPEEMPVDVFYRDETEFSEIENLALSLCKGKILDIGAGVGSHALILQNAGLDVTALEISPTACSIMKQRDVKKVLEVDFFSYQATKYDTLLMLMNGIGLAGNLNNLSNLLQHCKKLLKDGGQIIFDSSDISYLYEDIDLPTDKYFGEVSYQYQYKEKKGDWFDWLYVDQHTLNQIANKLNFELNVIFEDDHDQYLARMALSLK